MGSTWYAAYAYRSFAGALALKPKSCAPDERLTKCLGQRGRIRRALSRATSARGTKRASRAVK